MCEKNCLSCQFLVRNVELFVGDTIEQEISFLDRNQGVDSLAQKYSCSPKKENMWNRYFLSCHKGLWSEKKQFLKNEITRDRKKHLSFEGSTCFYLKFKEGRSLVESEETLKRTINKKKFISSILLTTGAAGAIIKLCWKLFF